MLSEIDTMTQAELDLALAELLPELQEECVHCGGHKTDLYHQGADRPCCLCQGRGWSRLRFHLEDLLVLLAHKEIGTWSVCEPVAEFKDWNWTLSPDESALELNIDSPVILYTGKGETPLLAVKRAALKALQKERDA